MIDFIKKKKTLLSSHALLLKPNCQILSNLVKIIKSLKSGFMSESCKIASRTELLAKWRTRARKRTTGQ